MTRTTSPRNHAEPIERVQTGVRIEKRLLKVLKAVAEYKDLSLGDLLEGVQLHAFEGKAPFGEDTLQKIAQLRAIYRLDLDASDSHLLAEVASPARRRSRSRSRTAR
ncbi:MAG: hypothetical protein AB7P21_11515 [Lautropia sp.]